jgi:SAM-dependent methyltransferase
MKVCLRCQERFNGYGWRCSSCGYYPDEHDGFLAFSPAMADTNEGFRPEYFNNLASLEAANFWFTSRNLLIIWALRRYFAEAKSFLEIGCGTGFVLCGIRREFPALKLAGSEIFTKGLAFARQRLPRIELFQMDACRIPFDSEFDAIGAFDVLEHIEEDESALREMFQATKPGGGIMLTVPQHPFLWSRVDDYSFHKRRYTRKELVKKLSHAGFRITRLTSFASFILPLMMISRVKAKKKADFDPFAEYQLGHRLNRLLENIMGLERRFITAGVSLSAGGSLFAVAKRPVGMT